MTLTAEPVEAVLCGTSAAGGEDALGFRRVGDALHLWVIDGATAVTDRPKLFRPDLTDPAWFARSLSRAIWKGVATAPLTPDRLAPILAGLGRTWFGRVGADHAPHEPPIAAMTYARLRLEGSRVRLDGMAYADCVLHALPALRPIPTPRLPLPPLPRNAGLPRDPQLMQRLRTRRTAQNLDLASSAVTLDPASAWKGRPLRLDLTGPAMILLGSDGFARPWQEYRLAPRDEVLSRVARQGALRQVLALRRWEESHPDHGTIAKPQDDVAALVVQVSGHPVAEGWTLRRGPGSLHLVRDANGRRRAAGWLPDL